MGQGRSSSDWIMFAVLSLLWASAFGFTRMAVSLEAPEAGFPPYLIIPARLTIAAIILLIAARVSGQAWPPLHRWKDWLAMAVMGTLGTAAPFFAITVAQETIDSSLAALYIAAAPLFVAVFAHIVFHDDRLTRNKVIGLMVGFTGVVFLFGPSAFATLTSASTAAQALCLLAATLYAGSTILARFVRAIPPFVFAAGFVSIGAFSTFPMLFFVDYSALKPSGSALIGLVSLGVFPTAAASIAYTVLVQRTSATFLGLTGYTIPILSVIIGFAAFGETQNWNAAAAFVLILIGVWQSQRPSVGPR